MPQFRPQAPQLSGSRMRSRQAPEHMTSPAMQEFWHVPSTQIWPEAQALPQVPQFRWSVSRSAHEPEQST